MIIAHDLNDQTSKSDLSVALNTNFSEGRCGFRDADDEFVRRPVAGSSYTPAAVISTRFRIGPFVFLNFLRPTSVRSILLNHLAVGSPGVLSFNWCMGDHLTLLPFTTGDL